MDITQTFKQSLKELPVGKVLLSKDFSLHAAMMALQVMNNRLIRRLWIQRWILGWISLLNVS
jgi:hypothetical protein